jgi:hypothetical protein
MTLAALHAFLAESHRPFEIIFVCDGVTDGSDRVLVDWANRRPGNVRVLAYSRNRGKGHAVRLGMLAARGEWRIFTDIDLAYPFADIEFLARRLREGARIAIASRVHRESRILVPPRLLGYMYRRSLQSRIFSAMVRSLLPIRQGDTQAGLKGMHARIAVMLLPCIRADRFEFDCELLTAASRLKIEVAETPVTVAHDGAGSTVTGWSALQMLAGVHRIARRWRSGISLSQLDRPTLERWTEHRSQTLLPVEMAA